MTIVPDIAVGDGTAVVMDKIEQIGDGLRGVGYMSALADWADAIGRLNALIPLVDSSLQPLAMGQRGAVARARINALNAARWWRADAYRIAALDGGDLDAGLTADFRRGRYALPMGLTPAQILAATPAEIAAAMRACAFADMFEFSRASSATDVVGGQLVTFEANAPRLSANGALLEGAAVNLWLNSAVGATQSFTVTAQTYTLTFFGAGSVTLAGAYSAVLTGTGAANRARLTFTPSAGVLTATVSGSIASVQLEAAAEPSSYILTGAGAVTRAADNARLTPRAAAVLQRASAGLLVQGQGVYNNNGRLIGTTGGLERIVGFSGTGTPIFLGSAAAVDVSGSVTHPLPAFGIAGGWSAAGKAGSYNGRAVATQASALDTSVAVIYLGRNVNGTFASGYYHQLVAWPERPANAALPGKAIPYV